MSILYSVHSFSLLSFLIQAVHPQHNINFSKGCTLSHITATLATEQPLTTTNVRWLLEITHDSRHRNRPARVEIPRWKTPNTSNGEKKAWLHLTDTVLCIRLVLVKTCSLFGLSAVFCSLDGCFVGKNSKEGKRLFKRPFEGFLLCLGDWFVWNSLTNTQHKQSNWQKFILSVLSCRYCHMNVDSHSCDNTRRF